MFNRHGFSISILCLSFLACSTQAGAQDREPAPLLAENAFEPLLPYIGTWQSAPLEFGGRTNIGHNRLEWGNEKRTFLRYEADFEYEDGTRVPGFRGIVTWDPIENRAEFMIALGMRSGYAVQETGYFLVFSDRMVRHVDVRYGANVPLPPDGSRKAPEHGYDRKYMQIYRTVDDDTFETRILFLNESGEWVAALDEDKWIRYSRHRNE